MSLSQHKAVLISGATGYLGSLLAAELLAKESVSLVLPVRSKHTRDSALKPIVEEMTASGVTVTPAHLDRVHVVPFASTQEIAGLRDTFRQFGIEDIVHSAGCVDYFNTEHLVKGNEELTRVFLDLAQTLRVRRFFYISTAFCSGYRTDRIPEALHHHVNTDPTSYTLSKRTTEHLIAGSGVPYILVRPSIVIGNSIDGRYGGKRYGVYQLWQAAERFLCTEYIDRIYAIAPRFPIPILHQDAFQAGFLAAYREVQPNTVFHLVSAEATLPTVRDVWDLWLNTCARPREIHYYSKLADVPMPELSRQQQFLVEFTSVNIDIATNPWHFETTTLDRLRAGGLVFADATQRTMEVCQDRFHRTSRRVQTFMEKYRNERSVTPITVEEGEPTGNGQPYITCPPSTVKTLPVQ